MRFIHGFELAGFELQVKEAKFTIQLILVHFFECQLKYYDIHLLQPTLNTHM